MCDRTRWGEMAWRSVLPLSIGCLTLSPNCPLRDHPHASSQVRQVAKMPPGVTREANGGADDGMHPYEGFAPEDMWPTLLSPSPSHHTRVTPATPHVHARSHARIARTLGAIFALPRDTVRDRIKHTMSNAIEYRFKFPHPRCPNVLLGANPSKMSATCWQHMLQSGWPISCPG